MKEFKYKTSFSTIIKPVISSEKDIHLAIASVDKLKGFVPEIDSANHDLAAFAGNAFVANRFNKNDDAVDGATAISIAKNFINKPINIEHERNNNIGVILTVGYSEFGTDKPLTEEEVAKLKDPFNVVIGGVLWKTVNSDIVDYIENSGDPTSPNYLDVSISWELGFSEYDLYLSSGSRNLADCTKVEQKDFEEANAALRANDGKGKFQGKTVYRNIINDPLPLGVGLTETPAADVKGVATEKTEPKEESKSTEISQSTTETVNKVEESNNNMKITELKDITDESLKQCKATEVSDFLKEEIKKASETWETEKVKKDEQLKAAQDEIAKTVDQVKSLNSQIEDLNKTLKDLQTKEAERVASEQFTLRMATLDEKFELSSEDRSVIGPEVKALKTSEEFDGYLKKLGVLLNSKSKTSKETKASTQTKSTESAVSEAVKNAEVKDAGLPNNTKGEAKTMREKFASAFGGDKGITVKYGK